MTQEPDARTQTLNLLNQIVEATLANTAAIEKLVEITAQSLEASSTTMEILTNFANAAKDLNPNPNGNPLADQIAGQLAGHLDFTAEAIVMTYNDKGEPAYKALGHPYSKFGVRVWPEVLPLLGIDPDQLKPGPNSFHASVRALMGETGPKKIIGLASFEHPAPNASHAWPTQTASPPQAPTPPPANNGTIFNNDEIPF